jgi:hypothetical protein
MEWRLADAKNRFSELHPIPRYRRSTATVGRPNEAQTLSFRFTNLHLARSVGPSGDESDMPTFWGFLL